MSLLVRLYLAMVVVVVATAGLIGILAIRELETGALPLALEGLKTQTGLLATNLNEPVKLARDDVMVLSRAPPVRALAGDEQLIRDASSFDRAQWLRLLSDRFISEMTFKDSYLQMRLITRADNGREILRVDRSGPNGAIRQVPESELQAKNDRPYFQDTIAKPIGQAYVSPIDLNQEFGKVENPHVPVIRVGTPVRSAQQEPFGILIINIDMRPVLDALRQNIRRSHALYLINHTGDYLVHPDRSLEFGFDLGARHRIGELQPQLAAIARAAMPVAADIQNDGQRLAAATWPVQLGSGPKVTLILTAPTALLLGAVDTVKHSLLLGGSIAVALAILLALAVGYSITRPIKQMTLAVAQAPIVDPDALPTDAVGEAGVLARALARYARIERFDEAAIVSSQDAILTKTLDGIVTSWNPAAERLYGYSAGEAIGRHIDLIVPESRREELHDILRRIRQGELIENIQTLRLRKDGTILDISLTVSPVRTSAGILIGASSIARDITERLKSERRLQELQAEAAHSYRLNVAGEMAAALAHELNQPLTAISNYVKSARRRMQSLLGTDAGAASEYVDKADEQARRASQIVRQLRSFVDKRVMNRSPEDLAAIVSEALDLTLVGVTNLKVRRKFAADITTMPLDRIQIQQVVINLVRNAIEAMQNNVDRELVVTVQAAAGRSAMVSVKDNGSGIPAALAGQLFVPFATTKAQGMGIGLVISRSIIESHEGRLWAENNADGGATFSFEIPISDPTGDAHAA